MAATESIPAPIDDAPALAGPEEALARHESEGVAANGARTRLGERAGRVDSKHAHGPRDRRRVRRTGAGYGTRACACAERGRSLRCHARSLRRRAGALR